MILISDDARFTIWMHTLTRKPADATNAVLWIELDKDAGKNIVMTWTVEVKIYFGNGRCDERHRGRGKTRHEAFVCLRQRISDFCNINVRS